MKYTKQYLQFLQSAMERAPDFGITRPCDIRLDKLSEAEFYRACELVRILWTPIQDAIPGYLGNRCIPLAVKLYATLVAHDIPAEIVIGTIQQRGKTLFPCTVESLRHEVEHPGGDEDAVSLHAWVTVGGDTIIDGGLASRMAAFGDCPPSFDRDLLAARAHEFVNEFDARYEPLVVGSQFIALIGQGDPQDEVERIRNPTSRIRA